MDISDRPSRPERTPFELIGGEPKVRALVTRFYDLMDEEPDYFSIRKLHPESLTGSREKLFMFLTGWLGGSQLYVEAYGHPRLRARHLPFLSAPRSATSGWRACREPCRTSTFRRRCASAWWPRSPTRLTGCATGSYRYLLWHGVTPFGALHK